MTTPLHDHDHVLDHIGFHPSLSLHCVRQGLAEARPQGASCRHLTSKRRWWVPHALSNYARPSLTGRRPADVKFLQAIVDPSSTQRKLPEVWNEQLPLPAYCREPFLTPVSGRGSDNFQLDRMDRDPRKNLQFERRVRDPSENPQSEQRCRKCRMRVAFKGNK